MAAVARPKETDDSRVGKSGQQNRALLPVPVAARGKNAASLPFIPRGVVKSSCRYLVVTVFAILLAGGGCSFDRGLESTSHSDGPQLPESSPSDGRCTHVPPPLDYDPLSSWQASSPTPTFLVASTADSGPGSLREKLDSAANGDVVGFSPELAGKVIAVASKLYLDASVIIDGRGAPGLVLDGDGKTRILESAKAKDVTVLGLTFKNGYSTTSGGAIHAGQTDRNQSGGKLTVSGCTFTGNSGGRGGAIRVGWRTEGIIENCVFTGNDGTIGGEKDRGFSGGAIATSQSAKLTVRRCRFENNRGHNGGAIYNILQPIIVDSCVFVNNTAKTSGAVFTDGGNPAGPGNDPVNKGEISLRHLRIVGSRGSSAGGALMLWAYPGDEISIEHCIFHGNEVTAGGDGGKGGAARIHNPGSLLVANSTFADNRAYQQGGALWIDGGGPVVMENVTFSGNHVEKDAGGGFNYNGNGIVRINGALFADNYAGRACGAFWFGKRDLDMVVKNTIFAFNEAGQNIGERHMGFRPSFAGGILEYVSENPARGRVTESSTFADPLLGELQEIDGMVLRPLLQESPARGLATADAPGNDARGAVRDGSPDSGPFEYAAACGG
jgi:predicted outer membrane repeat protein